MVRVPYRPVGLAAAAASTSSGTNERAKVPFGSPNDKPAPMTLQQQRLIEQEDFYRRLFVSNRFSSEIADPYVSLLNVYENKDKFVYQEETEEEKAVPKILTKERSALGKLVGPCIAPSKEQFLKNFDAFTNGRLKGLNWKNVFVAGGAVLASLNSQSTDTFAYSDIDLFVYGLETDDEANQKLQEIFDVVTRNSPPEAAQPGRGAYVVRSFRAVTILGKYPDTRHVQIILRLLKSPAEVLLGFDVDCCAVGFDGTDVWASERCLRALTKRYNLVNVTRRSNTYESRLRKYSKRGYAVAVPNLDKSQVDPKLFTQQIEEVQGLAKLCLYEYYDLNPYIPSWPSYSFNKAIPRKFQQYVSAQEKTNIGNLDILTDITGTEDSEYADFVPWGPNWYPYTVLSMFRYKYNASMYGSRKNAAAKTDGAQQFPPHRHHYVSGIEGVIKGTNMACQVCQQKMPEKDESGSTLLQGPLTWAKDNVVSQDLDVGFFRRNILSGKEVPPEEDWTKGVYFGSYRPRDDVDVSAFRPPTSPSKTFAQNFTSSSQFVYDEHGKRFDSMNQLLRSQRESYLLNNNNNNNNNNTQDYTFPRTDSPYGTSVEAFGGNPTVDIFSENVYAYGGGTLPFISVSPDSRAGAGPLAARNLNSPPHKSLLTETPGPSHPSFAYTATSPPRGGGGGSFQSRLTAAAGEFDDAPAAPTSLLTLPAPPSQPPKWWAANFSGRAVTFANTATSGSATMSVTGQGLLLVPALFNKGAITSQQKSDLKDLILTRDPVVLSILEAFIIDENVAEVADSLVRLLEVKAKQKRNY